jgi:hypothetical protein
VKDMVKEAYMRGMVFVFDDFLGDSEKAFKHCFPRQPDLTALEVGVLLTMS